MRTHLLAIRASVVALGTAAAALGTAAGCGSPSRPADLPPSAGVAAVDGGAAVSTSAPAGDAGELARVDAGPPARVWQDVESPVCGIRAKMLGTPKSSVQTLPTEQGPAKLTMLMFEAPGGEFAMGIMCSEVAALRTSKASNDHILDGSRDGMIKNVHGTLTNEKALVFGGFPARQVAVQSKGQPVHARIVFMRSKAKIMTLITVGLDDETATAFLDSAAFR